MPTPGFHFFQPDTREAQGPAPRRALRLAASLALGLGLVLSSIPLVAQCPDYPGWRNETFARVATNLAVHGSHLWVGTEGGGVLAWNTVTGTYEKHTRVGHCLADDFINDIAVDPVTGAVWAATNRGLSMLPGDSPDGLWITFTTENSPLADDQVNAVAAEPSGVIWAGTFDAGLYRIEDSVWTSFDTSNSGLSDNFVTRIVIDSDDRKWIGVWSAGVDVFDDVVWRNHNPGNTWPNPPCPETCGQILTCSPDSIGLISFFADPLGTGPAADEVWIRNVDDGLCGLNGVTQHVGGTWRTFTEQNSDLPSNFVADGTSDAAGNVWIASQNGAARFDGTRWTHFPDMRGRAVERMGPEIWLGTPEGVVRHDGNFQPPLIPDGLAGARVYDFALQPSDGAAWIAGNNGLHFYDEVAWSLFDPTNSGLPHHDVRAVVLADNGDLWVGTAGGGVARFDGLNWEVFDPDNSNICCGNVTSLEIDGLGRVWAAYQFGGVSVYDGLSWQPPPAGLPSSSVTDLARAPNGDLWAGTPQGAGRLRADAWTVFTTAEGLPADSVRTVHVLPDGTPWIGTSAGVSRFDDPGFTTFSVGDDVITALGHDSEGNLWAGPRNGRTGIWDGADWTFVGFDDGLVFERVLAIQGGVDGRTWLGTEVGLSIHDAAAVPDVVPGEPALTTPPLRVARPATDTARLDLTWGASCSATVEDYAVYAGPLGMFQAAAPATCSTSAATAWSLSPRSGSRFYLVSALAGGREGSFGRNSAGIERPPSPTACRTEQDLAPCR